jgi:hypothetical protein
MDPEVTRVVTKAVGHRVSLSFRRPSLEPAMAEDFERWMLAELKDAITKRLEACVADDEPWPGGFIAVPIIVLPSGEYVCGTARVVAGEPAMH